MVRVIARWTSIRVADNDWNKILQLLERGRKEGDIFDLDNVSGGYGQASRLTIEFDEETTIFMPMMVVEWHKPFLYYDNPKAEGKWVEFAGAEMADRLFTDDFDLVVSMVREFYDTGWVKGLVLPQEMKGKYPTTKPYSGPYEDDDEAEGEIDG